MAVKVLVEDEDDLNRLSALLQDAIVRVGDVAYLKRSKRLALTLNRFCWEAAAGERRGEGGTISKRIMCGLHFDFVSTLKAQGIDQTDREGLLYLLALRFVPSGEAQGRIEFVFAGGATLAAEVECLEGAAADFGEPWLSENVPVHEDTDQAPEGRAVRGRT